MSVSLNKFISDTGLCSRREADRWIEAGRVRMNGAQAQKGMRVTPDDEVIVDGRMLTKKSKAKRVYMALHKPAGVTCTTDQRDPSNIIDYLDYPKRIFPIGRLDKASTGLLLLTNDGDIVNDILRVEKGKEKEYIVSVDRPVTKDFMAAMAGGLPILGTVTRQCEVEKVSKYVFRIVLTQGLNRQIRRMCEHLGYKVKSLHRVRIMHIEIGDLKPGKWRHLTQRELRTLLPTSR